VSRSGLIWLGYGHDSRRACLGAVHTARKALLLGRHANRLAAVAAYGAVEAGLQPIVFDFDGELGRTLSGHLESFDFRSFLYDSFRLVEPGPWHAQLVASAYTAALDLSTEEEAIINSAALIIAGQDNTASPASLFDIMGAVEGFRGFYVDKLKGRIGSLKLLGAADDETFERLCRGNLIVDFHRAPYPLAAELALALFLAKMVAEEHATGRDGPGFLLTDAHRLFRSAPRSAHGNRLMTHLLESRSWGAISSDQPHAVSPPLVDACNPRLYSSDAWNGRRSGLEILGNSFVMEDQDSGQRSVFVPRRVHPAPPRPEAPHMGRSSSPALQRMLLEEIERFPLSTRESLVRFLSPEFLEADVNSELDDIHTWGLVLMEPKDNAAGPKVFAYTLTPAGHERLKELRD